MSDSTLSQQRLVRIALGVAVLLLSIGFVVSGQPLGGLAIAALIVAGEFGRSSPKRYTVTKIFIANVTFALLIGCIIFGAYIAVPTGLLIALLLAAVVYWDLDALHWRLASVDPTEQTTQLVKRHYRFLATLIGLSVIVYLLITLTTLEFSAWTLIGIGLVSFTAFALIVRRLSAMLMAD